MLPLLLFLGLGGCEKTNEPAQTIAVMSAPQTFTYQVRGMHCQGCVDAINLKVNKVAGVASCSIDLDQARAVVMVSPEQEASVHNAIVGLGYEVTPLNDDSPAG